MAEIKISAMADSLNLTGTDIFPIVRSGVNYKSNAAYITSFLGIANLAAGFSITQGSTPATLSITSNSAINQDLRTTASPNFTNITSLGNITATSAYYVGASNVLNESTLGPTVTSSSLATVGQILTLPGGIILNSTSNSITGKINTIFNINGNGGLIRFLGNTEIGAGGTNNIAAGTYSIGGTSVLTLNTLGSSILYSSLTKIGLTSAGFVKTDASGNLTSQTGISISDISQPSAFGNIFYGNGTAFTSLPIGTSGQFLSVSLGGIPFWTSSSVTIPNPLPLGFLTIDGTNTNTISSSASFPFVISSASSQSILLNPVSGNVGIGVSPAAYKLDVGGDINTSSVLRIKTLDAIGATGSGSQNTIIKSAGLGTIFAKSQSYTSDPGAVYITGTNVNSTSIPPGDATPLKGRTTIISCVIFNNASDTLVFNQSGGISNTTRISTGWGKLLFEDGLFINPPIVVCQAITPNTSAFITGRIGTDGVQIQMYSGNTLADGVRTHVLIIGQS